MIIVTATITAKKDKVDEVLSRLKEVKAATIKEEGYHEYRIHQLAENPTQILFYERWESLEHLEMHGKSEHFTKFADLTDILLDKTFDIKIYNEVL